MEIIMCGDTHGNSGFLNYVILKAKKYGIKKVVVCGDFGLWTNKAHGPVFLDSVNDTARKYGVRVYAIGGNHECWPHWNWYVENLPQDHYGFTVLRTHIMLAPRVHDWTWGGKQFGSVAGAVSIDKDYRRPGSTWFPEEEITDKEVEDAIMRLPYKMDYLVTHDCSNRTPWETRLKDDLQSEIHRRRIDRVLDVLVPKMHFHGHMHEWYNWQNPVGNYDQDLWCQTYGLECDGMQESWGILDTADNTFLPATAVKSL